VDILINVIIIKTRKLDVYFQRGSMHITVDTIGHRGNRRCQNIGDIRFRLSTQSTQLNKFNSNTVGRTNSHRAQHGHFQRRCKKLIVGEVLIAQHTNGLLDSTVDTDHDHVSPAETHKCMQYVAI